MSGKITENHRIVTFEHEMNVEGNHLVEKKQKTIIEPKDDPENSGVTTILVHVRSIGERCVKVTKTTHEDQEDTEEGPERVVETDLTELEVQEFEHDWQRLWTPKLTEKTFE